MPLGTNVSVHLCQELGEKEKFFLTFQFPHFFLKRSPPLNPATFLPLIDAENDHDCTNTTEMRSSPRPDLLQILVLNSDMTLYTDGSVCRPSDNKHLAGNAIVNDWEVLGTSA